MSKDNLVVSLKSPPQKLEEPPVIQAPLPAKKTSRRVLMILAMLFILGLIFSGGIYWFAPSLFSSNTPVTSITPVTTNVATGDTASTSARTSDQEILDLVSEVNKLILLPVGETPTVATVSDPSKLANQAFFANAKVGDKVLLFTKARKAYLYDPAQHRLIEVASITSDGQQQ